MVEVPVESKKPLKTGDVLFRIDPTPYATEVQRLEAGLADAVQNVKILKVEHSGAQAAVARAEAQLVEAKQKVDSMRSALDAAQASVRRFAAQLKLTEDLLKRTTSLVQSRAAAKEDLERDTGNDERRCPRNRPRRGSRQNSHSIPPSATSTQSSCAEADSFGSRSRRRPNSPGLARSAAKTQGGAIQAELKSPLRLDECGAHRLTAT